LSVSGEGTDLRVSTDRDALVGALHRLGERIGPGAAVEKALDGLTEKVAKIAVKSEAAASRGSSNIPVTDAVKAQLRADQTLTSMLFAKPPQGQAPNASARKTADAYGNQKGVVAGSTQPSIVE